MWTGTQGIISPRHSIIAKRARNAEPFDAPINRFLAENGHSTSIFRKLIGLETVPGESADVYVHKRMDFASSSVIYKSPNFIDLGLSHANTTDKLKSVFAPTIRVEGLTDISDWLVSRYGIE